MKKQTVSNCTPALLYLEEIARHIAAIRKDMRHFVRLGHRMAKPLLAGGNLYAVPVAPYFPSEFCGRAGGLMGVRYYREPLQNKNDVALFALPDPRFWRAGEDAKLRELLASPAELFVVGNPDELPAAIRKRVTGFTGGASIADGDYAFKKLRPLTGFRTFEQMVRRAGSPPGRR